MVTEVTGVLARWRQFRGRNFISLGGEVQAEPKGRQAAPRGGRRHKGSLTLPADVPRSKLDASAPLLQPRASQATFKLPCPPREMSRYYLSVRRDGGEPGKGWGSRWWFLKRPAPGCSGACKCRVDVADPTPAGTGAGGSLKKVGDCPCCR